MGRRLPSRLRRSCRCQSFSFGGYEKFTGLELYFYYNNCLKVVKKRRHAWASRDNRDAAHLRYWDRQAAGRMPRYGHYRILEPPPPGSRWRRP